MQPLVSILIPAHNAEKWLAGALRSAIEQTWQNKEVIVVDDGSTDRTLIVANGFRSPHVKVLSQENKGAAAARNCALEHAQGDYIQWLDADDLLDSAKISEQLKYVDGNLPDLTLLSASYGSFYYRVSRAQFNRTRLWTDLSPIDWLIARFSEPVWMINSAWLTCRQLVELAGPWDERLSLDDDGEYFCRVVSLSAMVKYVGESKSYYRDIGGGSLSQRRNEKSLESQVLSTKLCVEYLRGLEDSERTRAACVKFLRRRSRYFFPKHKVLLRELLAVAEELGSPLMSTEEWLGLSHVKRLCKFGRLGLIGNMGERVAKSVSRKWDRVMWMLEEKCA